MRIIVADDTDSVREVVTIILEGAGCKVFPVANAADAMELLTSVRGIDAVITDYCMGPGQNGVGLLCEMRSKGFDMPVILMTGTDNTDAISQELPCGMHFERILPKPTPRDTIRSIPFDLAMRATVHSHHDVLHESAPHLV